VVSKIHRLANERVVNLGQLHQEKFVFMSRKCGRGFYDDAISLCTNAHFSPHIVAEAGDIGALFMLVEMNSGVTILPSCWKDYLASGDNLAYIGIDDPKAFREIGLTWNPKNKNPRLKRFLKEMGLI
jgi:DNA-binding transcriptional LysR family regulator